MIYVIAYSIYKRKHPEKLTVRYPEGEKMLKQWARDDAHLAEYERVLAEKEAAAIVEAKLNEEGGKAED